MRAADLMHKCIYLVHNFQHPYIILKYYIDITMSVLEEIKAKIKEAGGNKDKIAELTLSGIKIKQFTKPMTELLE